VAGLDVAGLDVAGLDMAGLDMAWLDVAAVGAAHRLSLETASVTSFLTPRRNTVTDPLTVS
jgi:hypothetical protein